MVHPIFLGKGERLFAEGSDQRPVQLASTKTFASGIVVLEYEAA
jgi:dihydrofolate reductase